MTINKIILPDFVIADLYKESLVDINVLSNNQFPREETLSAENDQTEFLNKIKYDGENNKNVTVVVNQPDTTFIDKEDLSFLTNILKACQLSNADIAIVNAAAQQVTFTAIKEQLNPVQFLLFDVDPSSIGLPFKIPFFQVQNYAESAIMSAPALSDLNKPTPDGKLLKTKLWNSLKQIFNIN